MSLQSKPELRGVAKEKRQSECRLTGNRSFAFEYLADSNGGNFDFPRKDSRSNSIRNEKFFTQNFAGMNRWNFFHNTYLDSPVENLNPLHLLQRQSKEVFDTLIFVKKREIFWSKFCSIFSLFLYRRKIVSLSQSIERRYFSQAKKDNALQHNIGETK